MKISFSPTWLSLIFLALACQSSQGQVEEETTEKAPIVQDHARPALQQLIVVTTNGWDDFHGQLQRFEGYPREWEEVGEPIAIVTGKKGLAWGRGEKTFEQGSGPLKKEGDLRSPAGWFNLGSAFGYAPESRVNDLLFPYLTIDKGTMCIEDGQSRYYNQIVEEGEVPADWNSTDHMLRKDDLYEWGVFVEHNFPQPEAAGGSCIFLHVWRSAEAGTAGCTAMAKNDIVQLIRWLDESKNPQMVQLPGAVYQEINEVYDLPYIK